MQNNVSGKSQDYYTTMSHQEKRQPVESWLKEVPDRGKSSLLQLRTPHQSKIRTANIKNYYKT